MQTRQYICKILIKIAIWKLSQKFSVCFHKLTLRHTMKKSIVNRIPVNGTNFKSPKITTNKKWKSATKMSSDMKSIKGARNSRWSFLKPTQTKMDDKDPSVEHPRNIMLNRTLAAWKLEWLKTFYIPHHATSLCNSRDEAPKKLLPVGFSALPVRKSRSSYR